MADSSIDVDPGTGASKVPVDTRTNAGGDHRQVVVVGDPSTTAGVAPVDASKGLAVHNAADTGTASQVADNAADVTILAANAARMGASVYNDSSAILYLLVAAGTASTTNYTVQLNQNDYYEVPAGYTGILKGIWASDPGDGAARVTEWDNA